MTYNMACLCVVYLGISVVMFPNLYLLQKIVSLGIPSEPQDNIILYSNDGINERLN